ncbi:hypothetical protein ACGC1H_001147 [Rhizoctonia solani]
MSEACVNCKITLNNDIMPLQVRVALYAQIIFAWGMSLKYPNTFVKNSRAAYMIATGLLVASLIQWKTHELGLLDALVVSFMTSMMTIFIVVSGTSREEAKVSGQPGQIGTSSAQANTPPTDPNPPSTLSPAQSNQPVPPSLQPAADQSAASDSPKALRPWKSRTQRFILFCFVNIWGGFCFSLWSDPTHFGLKGAKVNCTTNNDVTIWVFGIEVQAVNPRIRIAALVLVSILYFVALSSLFLTLENVLDPAIRIFRLIGSYLTPESLKSGNATSRTTTPRSLHEDPVINSIHYILHFFAFGTLVYLLLSTEMTIRNNDKEGATRKWSYGQIIALILLLQQLMDICSTYVEVKEERQTEKEQEERKKQRTLSQVDTRPQDNVPMKDLTPTTPIPTLPI